MANFTIGHGGIVAADEFGSFDGVGKDRDGRGGGGQSDVEHDKILL